MKFYDSHGTMIEVPIETQDEMTLLEWGWTLNNTWNWPESMPGKPNEFDNLHEFSTDKSMRTKFAFTAEILSTIMKIVGMKKFLWYHHVIKKQLSEEDFQSWWIEHVGENRLMWLG